MLRVMVWLVASFGCTCAVFGQALAKPDEAAKMKEDEVLAMTHTGGWGAGVLADFHVKKDGQFVYTTKASREAKPETIQGTLAAEQIAALTKKIAEAGEGPGAEDAGYVEFLWRSAEGKAQSRGYSLPHAAPCAALMKAVDELAKKQAKAPATQAGEK